MMENNEREIKTSIISAQNRGNGIFMQENRKEAYFIMP